METVKIKLKLNEDQLLSILSLGLVYSGETKRQPTAAENSAARKLVLAAAESAKKKIERLEEKSTTLTVCAGAAEE